MHDLACPGRFRPGSSAFGACAVPCASRPQAVTDASGIGDGMMPRPEQAGSRPEADDLVGIDRQTIPLRTAYTAAWMRLSICSFMRMFEM